MTSLPLEGIRICDLTTFWSGSYTTMFLGAMGAEVIKVESIQRPDNFRFGPKRHGGGGVELWWETFPMFLSANLNKLDVTLNLNQPHGVALFKELVKISDVVIDNFSPRVMENFNLTYPMLKEVKSDIIVMSMSAHGYTGPWRDHAGFALAFEHLGGMTHLTGFPDSGPSYVGGAADAIAGMHGAFALLAALEYRRRSGKGQFIDMSQVEALSSFMGAEILDFCWNNRVRGRMGNRDRVMAPHGMFRCAGSDAWIGIAVESDSQWQALCRVMGNAQLAADERFATVLGRWEHQDELEGLIAQWTSDKDNYYLMQLLQREDVSAGVAISPDKMHEDPHVIAREFFGRIDRDVIGRQLYPRFPMVMSETPQRNGPAPTLGQHNEYVLGTLLGVPAIEIEQLERDQIIGTRPII